MLAKILLDINTELKLKDRSAYFRSPWIRIRNLGKMVKIVCELNLNIKFSYNKRDIFIHVSIKLHKCFLEGN